MKGVMATMNKDKNSPTRIKTVKMHKFKNLTMFSLNSSLLINAIVES